MKRLIVGVDGTWQDADFQGDSDMLTNVTRLLRGLLPRDPRTDPAVEQVKLYIAGVGTGENAVLGVVQGAMGTGLLEKVRVVYDFLSLNYEPGDEITLIGFSRGAYCVRLVASLIGLIGIIAPSNLHRFPPLFEALCSDSNPGALRQLLHENNEDRLLQLDDLREMGCSFLVKSVLVFDTVPIKAHDDKAPGDNLTPIRWNAFGLPSDALEPHIENALQALALDEQRSHYVPLLFRKDLEKPVPGQTLLQMYFSGCHTDVGGGYKEHDLADISLKWAISHLSPYLAFDADLIERTSLHPVAPYGRMKPHHGFTFTKGREREIPLAVDPETNLFIHSSVLHQPLSRLNSRAREARKTNLTVFPPLLRLECRLQDFWAFEGEEQLDEEEEEKKSGEGEMGRGERKSRRRRSSLGFIEEKVEQFRVREKMERDKLAGAGNSSRQKYMR